MILPINEIPDKSSDATAWMQFHQDLKSRYGLRTANSIWVMAWQKYGSTSIIGVSNKGLRDYMSRQGVTLDESFAAQAQDLAGGVFGKLGELFKIGEYGIILTGGVLLFGVALIVYRLARPEVVSTAASAIKR